MEGCVEKSNTRGSALLEKRVRRNVANALLGSLNGRSRGWRASLVGTGNVQERNAQGIDQLSKDRDKLQQRRRKKVVDV